MIFRKVQVCVVLSIIFTILVAGCGEKSVHTPADDLETQSNWTAHGSNPVITKGQVLKGSLLNDPCVIKEGSTYVMYLTGNLGSLGENVVPFRATSPDGITWDIDPTPLLSKGENKGDFDFGKVETPSVIIFNGKYHMYYTAVQALPMEGLSIGHATSQDGISWSKEGDAPVLAPTSDLNDWNGAQVAEPGAVVYNKKVYLYFTAVGLRPGGKIPQAKSTIGLAVSDDGYTFGPPIRVLEQGPLYPAEQGYLGYSTPAALVIDGEVHVFHDVAMWFEDEEPSYVQVALHHAVSPDGVSGWVSDENPIFTRNSFEWTQREIRAPTVIHDGDELKMWFAGDDFLAKRTWGIGYAASDLISFH